MNVGDTFEGPSKTLTDAHFLLFSGITGDVHPSHYDVEYAKQTRFGKPLAHGLLLSSLTALGASTAREKLNGLVIIEQGYRHLKPAMVGDTLLPQFLLEKIWEEKQKTFYRFKTTLSNQRDETVLEGFHIYRLVKPVAPTPPPPAREAITGDKPWPAQYTYVPALRTGNTIWISGTTGTDESGKITAPGDIVEQTRQIFRKFDALLRSVGGTCDDIVQTHDFFTTTENYKATAAVRREFFKTSVPTSAGVQVNALLRKDALIEISAVAVLRDE